MNEKRSTFSGHGTGDGRSLGPGTRLGNYTLLLPLGAGAMGQVWKARDEAGDRDVAVKMLPPELRGNPDAIAQVRKAFQQVHALTHQHIGKTLGMFDDPQHGPYVVMDLVPGMPLSRVAEARREQNAALTVKNVVKLLLPVAEALDYAHSRGVLHRDIKPQNVLVQLQPTAIITLIDFGLAAAIRSTTAKFTQTTIDSRGTRPYMSPEQVQGRRQEWDGRTDQYSLAAMAYELLSGFLPFDCDDDFTTIYAIVNQQPAPINGQPDAVNQVLLKGLAKNKAERFTSCVALIRALQQAITEETVTVAVREPQTPSSAPAEPGSGPADLASPEQAAWQRASSRATLQAFQDYLSQWPRGTHAEEARRQLRLLTRTSVTDSDQDATATDSGPDGQEKQAWFKARRADKLRGYENYLEEWPDGFHAEDARQAIQRLDLQAQRRSQARVKKVWHFLFYIAFFTCLTTMFISLSGAHMSYSAPWKNEKKVISSIPEDDENSIQDQADYDAASTRYYALADKWRTFLQLFLAVGSLSFLVTAILLAPSAADLAAHDQGTITARNRWRVHLYWVGAAGCISGLIVAAISVVIEEVSGLGVFCLLLLVLAACAGGFVLSRQKMQAIPEA